MFWDLTPKEELDKLEEECSKITFNFGLSAASTCFNFELITHNLNQELSHENFVSVLEKWYDVAGISDHKFKADLDNQRLSSFAAYQTKCVLASAASFSFGFAFVNLYYVQINPT